MLRTVALNALFLLAGCSSAAVETILYRIALVAIVVMLGALWTRARVKRATRPILDIGSEKTFDACLAILKRTQATQSVPQPFYQDEL